MSRRLGTILSLVLVFNAFTARAAEPGAPWFLSVPSVKAVCLTNTVDADTACNYCIHGVVETWAIWDQFGESTPATTTHKLRHCKTIGNVSDGEWKRIVRVALQTTDETGFASAWVMQILRDQLCK
jgi:hypothetical protein